MSGDDFSDYLKELDNEDIKLSKAFKRDMKKLWKIRYINGKIK